MRYLRQSTAATVAVGPFVAKADGVTPVTSLTPSSTLNGRAVSNGAGAAYAPASFAHDANGHYLAALATGDVPAAGRLRLEFSDPATFVPTWEDFTVLAPAVYDSLFGTTALSTYAGGAVALTSGERTTLAGVILSDVSDTLGADIVAIKAKADNLPAAPASTTNITAGAITAVANIPGVVLCTGSVAASPSPTATLFTAAGLPAATAAGYAVGRRLIFQSGALAGLDFPVASHAGGGSAPALGFAPGAATAPGVAPGAGDTFVIA